MGDRIIAIALQSVAVLVDEPWLNCPI